MDLPPIHPPHKNNPRLGTTTYDVYSTSKKMPNIIDRTIMRPIVYITPAWVLPNYMTILRFIMIPFVITSLVTGDYKLGLILFIIAAFTDAWDGAIARIRGQISDWGKLFDPLADKLLIGTTAVIVVVEFLSLWIALAIILIEVGLITYNLFFLGRRKKTVSARFEGKIKMIFQCIGVGFVLLYAVNPVAWFLVAATYILYAAIFFGALSLFVYRTI